MILNRFVPHRDIASPITKASRLLLRGEITWKSDWTLTLEGETGKLSRNVGKELTLAASKSPEERSSYFSLFSPPLPLPQVGIGMVSQFRPLHVASFSRCTIWRCVVPAVGASFCYVYKLYVVTQVCFLLRCSVRLTVGKLSFTSSRKLHLTPPHSGWNLGKLYLTIHD